ncbi:uncharacterized protein LOC126585503 isoform X2 [Malus sylvestris]|uniref:uncharacterized protein LOC126585503 isoform X2 n=1 Tax=Malus sylvestris TaxID=3752 RepID=UPI0021AC55C0|nr:uncharacterized protein LOC126585503 isoform X2 [Malus sylvestris]
MNLFVEQQSFPGKMQLARIGPRFKSLLTWRLAPIVQNFHILECDWWRIQRRWKRGLFFDALQESCGFDNWGDYELKKCVVSDPEATFTTWSEEYGSLIWQI